MSNPKPCLSRQLVEGEAASGHAELEGGEGRRAVEGAEGLEAAGALGDDPVEAFDRGEVGEEGLRDVGQVAGESEQGAAGSGARGAQEADRRAGSRDVEHGRVGGEVPAPAVDAPPQTPIALELVSPETAELRVTVPPGEPGEVRDLGDLRAPAGMVVTGRLVGSGTGTPVSGARVWAPRPGPGGPLLAWARGDLAVAQSGPEGDFRLAGLPRQHALVRIDAPGWARAYREAAPEPGSGALDLGVVELDEGATVVVEVGEEEGAGTVARVDPRGEGLALDFLTAPAMDGRAVVRNVPLGAVQVAVVQAGEIVCEEEVVLSGPGEEVVHCRSSAVTVRGTVVVGGRRAGAGILAWSRPAGETARVILNTRSPGGLVRQEVLSPHGPAVRVEVSPEGSFVAANLRRGPWAVLWQPPSGGTSAPLEVRVPEAEEVEIHLVFPGRAVAGRVVDGQGEPVAGARVLEISQGAFAIAAEQGQFELPGLEPGVLRLQARSGSASSEVLETLLEEGREAEPIELRLESKRDELAIRVLGPEGDGRPGAFVFVDAEGQGIQILTADQEGSARAAIQPPYPLRWRAAAASDGVWAFGPWQSWEERRAGQTLTLGAPGALLILADQAGPLQIAAPGGWDLALLMARLGRPLRLPSGVPLRLDGLPPGAYRLQAGTTAVEVRVEEGREVEVALP